jgi:hypothetical protein
MRKLILVVATLATTVTAAFAEDFVDDVMILKVYRNNCNPVILTEMMAVNRAASAAGLDKWSSSFYREVEKRRKDYVSKTSTFGTQEWCEKAKQQIETDYKRLTEAEEADKSKPKAPVAKMPPEQVPNCDLFRKRFVEALRVLSLRLPSLKLKSEGPDPLLKDDTWTTDGWQAKDTGELWYITTVHCRAGKFYDVFSDIDTPAVSLLHPTFDLIAASIYAFTGWDADKVVRTANEVLKNRSRDMADIENTELSPGAYAKIAYTSFAIELD